jgi:hypothetical protein
MELMKIGRLRDTTEVPGFQMAVGETEVAWTLFEKLLAF